MVCLTLGKDHTGWSIYDLGAFEMALMLVAKERGIESIPAYEIIKYPAELRPLWIDFVLFEYFYYFTGIVSGGFARSITCYRPKYYKY